MNNEPVAIRYDFDGYGYQYMDSGSGSDWQTRAEGEFLYTHPVKELTDEEIGDFTHRMVLCCGVHPNSADINVLGLKFIVEEILRKASEK